MDNVVDLTACLAKGKVIRINDKEYEIKFSYSAIRSLEEQYGSVDAALESFISRKDIYNDVLNFLYASCAERYKLKKTDIEEWISLSTGRILYNLVFEAILMSFGEKTEENKQGEA